MKDDFITEKNQQTPLPLNEWKEYVDAPCRPIGRCLYLICIEQGKIWRNSEKRGLCAGKGHTCYPIFLTTNFLYPEHLMNYWWWPIRRIQINFWSHYLIIHNGHLEEKVLIFQIFFWYLNWKLADKQTFTQFFQSAGHFLKEIFGIIILSNFKTRNTSRTIHNYILEEIYR